MALRKLIRSASALKSTTGTAVSGIAKGHAPRANQAGTQPPRARRADFQAALPKPQAQRNFTDPDSHILKGADGWIQGYNCQAAVDADHQVIVAIGVSNQPSDAVHLLPMLERIKANTGELPDGLIADAGYYSTANLEACEDKGLNAYISTSRQQHSQRPRPARGRAPRDLDARGRMERKLRSKAGHAVYAVRKTAVEPVFGQIKGARGLDRFRLRGLERVNGEWALMATTHNLLKLFRASMATA
nr:transposase [Cyanobium sp. HWJ4-Hawea]